MIQRWKNSRLRNALPIYLRETDSGSRDVTWERLIRVGRALGDGGSWHAITRVSLGFDLSTQLVEEFVACVRFISKSGVEEGVGQ